MKRYAEVTSNLTPNITVTDNTQQFVQSQKRGDEASCLKD